MPAVHPWLRIGLRKVKTRLIIARECNLNPPSPTAHPYIFRDGRDRRMDQDLASRHDRRKSARSLATVAILLLLLVAPVLAGEPAGAASDQRGLVDLIVEPRATTLVGRRSAAQLIVTGRYADGSSRDLSRTA